MNTASPASMTHVLTAIETSATIAVASSGLLEAALRRGLARLTGFAVPRWSPGG